MQAPEWVLVHGCLGCEGVAIGHAWLLHEGQVFCPTGDRIYSEVEYAAEMKAVILATYNQNQAATAVLAHRHYGPWHNAEGLLHRRDNHPLPSGDSPWMA